jgi:hypothetical protein
MSAGRIVISKYAASYGAGTAIHPIRVNEQTIDAAIGAVGNNPPTGAVNNTISAVVSRGARARGLNARVVFLKTPETGQPTGYRTESPTTIPALTEAFFNAAVDGAECEYNGVTYTVIGKRSEAAR